MNLRHVCAFVAVVEHGGFVAAARPLNLTQGAVSKHVRALERETGLVLLHRSNRGVTLTDAGEQLLAAARELVEAHERAEEAVRRIAGTQNPQKP